MSKQKMISSNSSTKLISKYSIVAKKNYKKLRNFSSGNKTRKRVHLFSKEEKKLFITFYYHQQ